MRARLISVFFIIFLFFGVNASFVSAQVLTGRCLDNSIAATENHFGCSLQGGGLGSTQTPRWSYDATDDFACNEGFDVDFAACSGTAPVCGVGEENCCLPCAPEVTEESVGHGGSCANGETCDSNALLVCRADQCLRRVDSVSLGGVCFDQSECGIDSGRPLVCEEGQCRLPADEFDPCTDDAFCQAETGNALAVCNPVSGTCVVSVCESNAQCRQALGDENAICNEATGACVINDSEVAVEEEVIDFSYCLQVPDGNQRRSCEQCIEQGEEGEYAYTAVGCVRTNGQGLTEDLVRLLMGVSGGVAIMSDLAGAFLLSVSRGDSSKVKEAKDLITASTSGLFFIIFSIFILQFVGVSILQIPGLG